VSSSAAAAGPTVAGPAAAAAPAASGLAAAPAASGPAAAPAASGPAAAAAARAAALLAVPAARAAALLAVPATTPAGAASPADEWIDQEPPGRPLSLLDDDKEEFIDLITDLKDNGLLTYKPSDDLGTLTSENLVLNGSKAYIQVKSLNAQKYYGVRVLIYFVDPKTNNFYQKPSWQSTVASTNWNGFSSGVEYLNLVRSRKVYLCFIPNSTV
jgi:hypothetical protein